MVVRDLGWWHIPLLKMLEVVVSHPVTEDANGVHGINGPWVNAAVKIVDSPE
jgi:hypothetical protein